ncbi:haloacid dehalogenase superfamily, subfamily IA, variant 3 with third motif having DD or ED [Thermus arciformis]|uniref:Haloacid dehalogenase superfamily, subfamily IA, variant 3 with third motif having DD or ED n=1 Tax=Thermus arciformis TaxID=482827 RepID=A0A1G7IYR1_9DEIN|nr:HAD-IA family hydrolase [Thermus arciformis]SDF17439.1 haloacid dehalogenase superfamily, subfamily IA, variant 3 with third motif having DD or ED [Thermus arciformis]
MVGLKALLFDLDGTLAETEELHREAFNRAFAHFGLPLYWDQDTYARLLWTTGGKERLKRALEETPGAPRLTWEEVAEVHRYKTGVYLELLRTYGVALRPGVRRLLAEAQEAGVKLVLATTTSPENAEAFLEGTGLKGRFSLVLAGDVVARKKPDPGIYLLAREALGLAPGEGVVVEDSRNGLLAGLEAGFPVLVTPSLYTLDQDFREAQALLPHLGDRDNPAPVLQGPRAGERVVVDLDYVKEVQAWWST